MSQLIKGLIRSAVSIVLLAIFFYFLLPYTQLKMVSDGVSLFSFVDSVYYLLLTILLIGLVALGEAFYYKWYSHIFSAFYIIVETFLLYVLLGSGTFSIEKGGFGLPASVIINFRPMLYILIFSELLIALSMLMKSFYAKKNSNNLK